MLLFLQNQKNCCKKDGFRNGLLNTPKTFSTDVLTKDMNILLRSVLAIIFFVIGFYFVYSFAISALIAFSIYGDIFSPDIEKPLSNSNLEEVTENDEGWLENFRTICESPAEIAFLDAMVSAFDLKPENRVLSGNGLKLQMQVPVDFYRLDFLVDKQLVVEVDGATYHSSSEAVERDERRDVFLEGKGFDVLRIPAKITLYSPQEAVDRVQAARADLLEKKLKKTQEMKERLRPAQILATVDGALTKFNADLKKFNQQLKQKSDEDAKMVAQRTEKRLKEIQEKLDADPELKKLYDELSVEWDIDRK